MKKITLSIVLLIALVISLSGCIKEANLNFNQVSPYVGPSHVDINGDSNPDISTYVFSDINLNENNQRIKVSRYVFVHPQKYIITYSNSDKVNKTELINNGKQLIISSKERIKECLHNIPKRCMGPMDCLSTCTAPVCMKNKDISFGNMLYDFSNIISDYSLESDSLAVLLTKANLSGKTDELANEMAKMYFLEYLISNHPAVKDFGVCIFHINETPYSPLDKSNINIEVSTTRAISVIKFSSHNLKNAIEINLVDNIPSTISDLIQAYYLPEDSTVITPRPMKIKYPNIKMIKDETVYLITILDGGFSNNEILFETWNNVDGSVRIVILDLPIVEKTMSLLYSTVYKPIVNITGTPYLSLGITFSFVILGLMILFQIIVSLYAVVQTLLEPKRIKEALLLSLGEADFFWKRKLSISITLIIIAYILETTMAAKIDVPSFSQSSLREIFSSDPWGFGAFSLYVVGLAFLYEVGLDRVKRIIGGKFYEKRYMEFTPESNRAKLNKLKEIVKKAKRMFDVYSEMGIDTSSEYQVLMSVPLEDLEALVKSDEDPYIVNEKLDEHIDKLNQAVEAVKNKEKIAMENWKKWGAYIGEELSNRDTISLESLVSIPYQWRVWAVTRYIEEHPEENLVIEGRIVKRLKISGEEKVKRLIKSGVMKSLMIGGIYIKSGKYAGGYVPYEKPTVISGVLMRLANYYEGIGSKIGAKRLILNGNNISLIVEDVNGSDKIVILCKKGDEDKAIKFVKSRFGR